MRSSWLSGGRPAHGPTTDQRHRGEDRALLASRDQVYELARAAWPDRWSGRTRNWQAIGAVWLKPERPEAAHRGHGTADALPHKAGGGGPMAGLANRAA
jgi:putative transposase